jgi:hypothetical protein
MPGEQGMKMIILMRLPGFASQTAHHANRRGKSLICPIS